MHGSQMDEQHLEQLALAEKRAASRAAARPGQSKAPAKPPTIELDPASRSRSVDDIAERLARIEGTTESDRNVVGTLRAARKAERILGDGSEISGTGFTIIKRADSPITRMLASGTISAPELRSSEDICTAFRAISGALFLKPLSMERVSASKSSHEPAGVIDAVSRYQHWANIWSARAQKGDPTLEIIIAAVWDERPFREIECDLAIRNGRASAAAAAGLRDYAARAGWAHGAASQNWLVGAGGVFRLRKSRPVISLRGLARKWDKELKAGSRK